MAADASNCRVGETGEQAWDGVGREDDVRVREHDEFSLGCRDERVHAVRLAVPGRRHDHRHRVRVLAQDGSRTIRCRVDIDEQFEAGHGLAQAQNVLRFGTDDFLLVVGADAEGNARTWGDQRPHRDRPRPQAREHGKAERIGGEWMHADHRQDAGAGKQF